MRDPFIAIDAATNLRSQARSLRRSWEGTRGAGPRGVRPVIEASWRRTAASAGVDPEPLHPRRAFDADALDATATPRHARLHRRCCAAAWARSPTTPST